MGCKGSLLLNLLNITLLATVLTLVIIAYAKLSAKVTNGWIQVTQESQSHQSDEPHMLSLKISSASTDVTTQSDHPRISSCRGAEEIYAKSWDGNGGIFDIFPTEDGEGIEVYCKRDESGRSWTVFQRRMDGSVDFYLDWSDYVGGFGDKREEFWLGLENIHQLTKNGDHELRIDMMDWEGNERYAYYRTFEIGDRSTGYRLTVNGYSGNAGDSLEYHSGSSFTTRDKDNDSHEGHNCAEVFKGAWWYRGCHDSDLNGNYYRGGHYNDDYATGVVWCGWKGHWYSLKFTEMKFRKRIY